MLRAVLFDLDDTLYDLRAHRAAALRAALAETLAPSPHVDLEQLVRAGVARHTYIAELPAFLRSHGFDDEALIGAAHARYRDVWFATLTPDPALPGLLAGLAARYRLGLVTNGPSWSQRPKIARFGLEQHMRALLVSEEVGVAKPDPAIFRLALAQLEVAAHEALYVGDSPAHDLRGAAAAGIDCIWLNRHDEPLPPGTPPPVATIRTLGELPALLDTPRVSRAGR